MTEPKPRSEQPRTHWYGELTGDALVPLALYLAGLWLCRSALAGVFPEGDDVPFHLARAAFGFREIFGRGHIDGWSPLFGAGSQNFLLYGPGVSLLFSAVKVGSFNALNDNHAFALVMCLSYASIGPAGWFMARSAGLGRRAAGLTGAAVMAVSIAFSVGLAGIFDLGLVANGIAAPLWCVGVGFFLRTLFDRKRRDQVGLAVAMVAMAITHIPTLTSFTLTAVILGLFAFPRLRSRGAVGRRLAWTAGVTLGLVAWWLIPLALDHDPRQPLSDWATPPWGQRLEELASGRFGLSHWLALVVMLGFVGVLVQPWPGRSPSWNTRLGTGLIMSGPLLMAAAFILQSRFPDDVALKTLPNRSSGYVLFLLILPAAQGWSRFWERVSAPVRRALANTDRVRIIGGLPVLVALAALVVHPTLIPSHELATNRAVYPEGVVSLAVALRADMAPQSRFVFAQDDELRNSFGIPHPEMWIGRLARRNSAADLGGSSVSWFDNYIVDRVWTSDWATIAPVFARAGVTHLIVGPAYQATMSLHPEYVEVFHNEYASIYRRVAQKGYPAPSALVTTTAPADVTLVHSEPERYRWKKRSRAGVDATLGIGYAEKWTARFNGRAVPLYRQSDGLLSLRIPPGTGTLDVSFERGIGDWFGGVVTVATMVALAALWRDRRRRADA